MKRFFLLLLVPLLFISAEDKKKKPKKDNVVIIETSFGEIHAILFDDTPLHKENFIKLAREGFYDSTTFHRVIKDFMIQGGDPNSKDEDPNNDGRGGPGYQIPAELDAGHVHTRGAIAAASKHEPDKKSSGSQFYIVQGKKQIKEKLIEGAKRKSSAEISKRFQQLLQKDGNEEIKSRILEFQKNRDYHGLQQLVEDSKPVMENEFGPFTDYSYTESQLNAYEELGGSPFLDREYTVYGKVIRGLDVLDSIASVKVDRRDRPEESVRMKVTIRTLKRKKITKEYGYKYPE